jgi:uncharacterized protein YihD (DUF1040 family)
MDIYIILQGWFTKMKDRILKEMKKLENDYMKQMSGIYQDNEVIHIKMDNLLLEAVDPEIKKEYKRIREKIGFWYA